MANYNSKNVMLVGLKGDTGDPAQLVNATGQATDKAMTQKAVTDNLNEANKKIFNLSELLKGNAYTVNQGTSPAYSQTVPTGAQKYAELAKVGGKSVVWNQLARAVNDTYYRSAGGSVTFSNGVATFTQTGTGDLFLNKGDYTFEIPQGNKIFVSAKIKLTTASTTFSIYGLGSYREAGATTVSTTEWQSVEKIFTITSGSQDYLYFGDGSVANQVSQIKEIVVANLTVLFGAGNEPSQLTDERIAFIKAYALANPAYNVGAIVSGKCDKVVTKKANTTQIAEYAIPAAVQALEGYGESAGTAYNYVDFNTKKFIKKVGKVDLGSLTWHLEIAYDTKHRFDSPISDAKIIIDPSGAEVICSRFTRGSNPIGGIFVDNTMTLFNGKLYILCDSYTDATAFKTAMSGVYLYYELATPVETDISAYLSDDNFIETEAGGTVIFHQQNDTKLPLYNEVNYMVKIEETL